MFSAAWLIEAHGRRVAAPLLAIAVALGTCDGASSLLITGNQRAFGQEQAGLPSSDDAEGPAARVQPPRKAVELLSVLNERHGVPLPGYVGGREFKNRERRLPRGRYREYDVNPKVRGRPRDAERIVIEQRTGKAYYTNDHYRTFLPLN